MMFYPIMIMVEILMNDREVVEHRIKIMQAFLDNKEIQHRHDNGEVGGLWYDGTGPKSPIPNFSLYEYRLKPNISRYKVGLFKDETGFCYASLIPENPENIVNRGDVVENIYFIKWLTDWIEHENQI